MRYIKYPIALIFARADVRLTFIPVVEILLAIISTGVTLGEVIEANALEDSVENVKVNRCDNKYKHITK